MDGIQPVGWEYHLAVTAEGMATIGTDRTMLHIARPGDAPLAIPSEPGWRYFTVSSPLES